MAHGGKGGNKSKPQKAAKHQRHFDRLKAKKHERQKKWEQDREYWANNKEYQEGQRERAQRIASYKPGLRFHLKAENEQKNREEEEQRKKRNKMRRREHVFIRS